MLQRGQARLLACAFVASAATSVAVGTAYAATIYGSVGTYNVAEINYTNQSDIANILGPAAQSEVWTTDGYSVAPGWMGVLPRLYDGNGTLCAQPSTYNYNSSATNEWSATVFKSCGSGMAYYSYGVTESWNYGQNYYQAYFTFRTPSQNF